MTREDHTWDVVVAGVGAVGSAALFHLARRGHRVVGVERHWVPNPRGSSHGRSRIFRTAFHDPRYVPLLLRARELWAELEEVSGERLFRRTGALVAGPPDGSVIPGTVQACERYEVEHERLSARELGRRYPAFRWPATHDVVLLPRDGILDPERSVSAWARMAVSRGATLRTGLRLVRWDADGQEVCVRLVDGEGREEELRGRHLLLTTGAWSPGLLGLAPGALTAERQVTGWLRPFSRDLFHPRRFPAFVLEVEEGRYYGFPELAEEGLKVGRFHHLGERVDPDHMDRTPSPRDRAVLRDFVERYFPEGAGELVRMETCLFTNTRDGTFVVGRHPRSPRVLVATGFNGYGFAFAPAVAEALADLAVEGETRQNLDGFSPRRFAE